MYTLWPILIIMAYSRKLEIKDKVNSAPIFKIRSKKHVQGKYVVINYVSMYYDL